MDVMCTQDLTRISQQIRFIAKTSASRYSAGVHSHHQSTGLIENLQGHERLLRL